MVKHLFWLFLHSSLIFPLIAQEAVLENLGDHVNSAFNEYAPVISPDGKTIYFIRKGHPNNTHRDSYDIWFSALQSDNTWGQAQNIGTPFNDEFNNFVTSVTPDGNTLVIGGYYKDGKRLERKGFSLIHKSQNGWSQPQGIDIDGYEEMDKGLYTNIWMSNDSKTLILSFSMLDTKPRNADGDLYVSFLQENGIWSRPVSLGQDINTELDESTPFLASDGLTLYFASNRQGSMGNHDIYVSKRLDDSWQKWSVPKRLDAPINSPSWDAYYSVPASGDYAYIISNHDGYGGSDIFKVKLKQEHRPDPVILVYGHVYDARTKKPVGAMISYDLLKDGTPVGNARSNPQDGSYKIVLKQGEAYGFRAESENYFAISENIDLSKKADYKEIRKDLFLAPIEKGETIRLNNLFFDYAQANLRPESSTDLMRLVDLLEKKPNMSIEIQGHTDNIGDDQKNLLLSESRAKSCVEYLVSKGIAASRMHYQGFGETRPLASNDTEEGRQQNRRVEFKIIEN